jgi:F0F1-type ATP synthase membrane subunit b/b'
VPWWTWLCLGIFLLSLVATAVFSVFAFGRLKRLSDAGEEIKARLDDLSRATEELQRRQARNQKHLEELRRHRARAAASIARLQVLTSAFSEATGRPRRARSRYLRKS